MIGDPDHWHVPMTVGAVKDPPGTSRKVGAGQIGAGEDFSLTTENTHRLKEELQAAVRKALISKT